MIFNRWRKYPKHKPKESGWYQCTVKHGYGTDKPRVMDLYFDITLNTYWWIDRRRQQVFDGYRVYLFSRAPIDDNRVFKDSLCERDDVLAWRKLPKVYELARRK